MANRLKKGDITIKEVLDLSRSAYTGKVDNKRRRMVLDIKSGKILKRTNLKYNKTTKEWEQDGREVKLVFKIKSDPVSYQKQDDLKNHYYPVTFLIKDWDKEFNSAFRWRTGSFFKWQNNKKKVSEGKNEKEKEKIRKDNKNTLERNIKKGLQGNFIFFNMWVNNQYELLWGPLTCLNKAPKKTNPKLIPFFDKQAYFVVTQILPKLFRNPKLKGFK